VIENRSYNHHAPGRPSVEVRKVTHSWRGAEAVPTLVGSVISEVILDGDPPRYDHGPECENAHGTTMCGLVHSQYWIKEDVIATSQAACELEVPMSPRAQSAGDPRRARI